MFSTLINPRTEKKLERYIANPSQALLLLGAAGSGKLDIAKSVAAKLLEKPTQKLESYGHFWIVDLPEGKKDIPVESIRDLVKQLRLQVPGKQNIRRVVVIKDAQLMNHQAQNAFLKALEEPAPGTVFILTASSKTSLLDTIVSRTAPVNVDAVDLETAIKYFKDYSKDEISAAWALSQGAPGLLKSLLEDQDSDLKKSVEEAKVFLTKTAYERLLILDGLKGKTELADLLAGLLRILRALYRASAARQDNKRTDALIRAFGAVTGAQEALETNVLPRLIILKLVLSLPL